MRDSNALPPRRGVNDNLTVTYPHARNLAVGGRAFARPSDGEVEEGEEVKDIGEGGVEPVVVCGMIVADLIETGD